VSSFTGTGALVRLALRRDRILLPVFMLILLVTLGGSASATIALYPDTASRLAASTVINSTASTLAIYGPIFDPNSVGALATFKTGMIFMIAVAVLAMRLVVRHTRAEEETGRLEMLGATVVGRYAPLTAAVLIAVLASVIAGITATGGLIAAELPVTGSVVMGLGYVCFGIAFAAVGAVVAQMTVGARAAGGLASAIIGVFYLFRVAGDATPNGNLAWLSWLSPVGWWQQSRPFAGDRLWPLALPLVLAAVLFVIAYTVAARRDFGAGVLPDRLGPANASSALSSPLGLAWRLQRASFIGWAVGFAVMGVVIGGLASNVEGFLQGPQMQELLRRLGGTNLTDIFLALELGFVAVFVSVYGLTTVLRLRSEETALLAEPVLATAVGRLKWAASHLFIALFGSAVLLAIAGSSIGAASAAQLGDSAQFGRVLAGALVQIPAVWIIIGIGVAAFGLLPGQTIIAWVALVGFVLLGELGPLFELDPAVMDVSPFAHTPRLPGGEFTWPPMLWLTAIAVVLIAAGLAGFRRRNIG